MNKHIITSKRLATIATELLNATTAVNEFGYSIGYPTEYCALQRAIDSAYAATKAAEYILKHYEETLPQIKDFTTNEE